MEADGHELDQEQEEIRVSPLRIAFLAGSLLCLSLGWTFGCVDHEREREDRAGISADLAAQTRASARLVARPGEAGDARTPQAPHGFVRFIRDAQTESDGSVRIIAELAGLTPGEHGFHVHETGDCSAADFASAGEHFATDDHKVHGMPSDDLRHAGDLGNIVANDDGTARLDRRDDVIQLDGRRSIVGRALIVHEHKDDGQDAKSAGGRVLCGVIERDDTSAVERVRDRVRDRDRGHDTSPNDENAQPGGHTIPPLTPPPLIP